MAINDISSPKVLSHLLKYDSIHGKYHRKISFTDNSIVVDNQKIDVALEGENLGRFILVDPSTIMIINEINYEHGINFNSLRNENIIADYIIIGPDNWSINY